MDDDNQQNDESQKLNDRLQQLNSEEKEHIDKSDELQYHLKFLHDEFDENQHFKPHNRQKVEETEEEIIEEEQNVNEKEIYNNKIIQKIFGKCSHKTPLAVPLYYFNIIIITVTLIMVCYDFYLMMSIDGFVAVNFLREIAFFSLVYIVLRNTYRNYYFYKLEKK